MKLDEFMSLEIGTSKVSKVTASGRNLDKLISAIYEGFTPLEVAHYLQKVYFAAASGAIQSGQDQQELDIPMMCLQNIIEAIMEIEIEQQFSQLDEHTESTCENRENP